MVGQALVLTKIINKKLNDNVVYELPSKYRRLQQKFIVDIITKAVQFSEDLTKDQSVSVTY